MPPSFIHQNFIDDDQPRIQVKRIQEEGLTSDLVDGLIASSLYPDAPSIGISPAYHPSGRLALLAIATPTKVLVYSVKDNNVKDKSDTSSRASDGRKLLEEKVLCHPNGKVFAFDLAELVLSLYADINLRVLNGIDIQSACPVKDRHPVASIEFAVGDSVPIYKGNIVSAFQSMELDLERVPDVVMRAWVSQHVPQLSGMEDKFEQVRKINTTEFTDDALLVLAKLTRDSQRLDRMKPVEVKHSITAKAGNKKGQIDVGQHRYQTRVSKGSNQSVRVEVGGGSGGSYVLSGRAETVAGKSATVIAPGILEGKIIGSITTIGRGGPTNAELQRRLTILRILQGSKELLSDNPWLQNIWFSSGSLTWPPTWSSCPASSPVSFEFNLDRHINDSQRRAIEHMLSRSNDSRITLIQGPPGTGKTSVIGSYVELAVAAGEKGIWLVAQSNVAVKNIAEKLAAYEFMDWRLIVSEQFHFDWHEHLYTKISKNIIQSSEFHTSGFSASKTFQGCQVVLCTISMLSNANLRRAGVLRMVPITTLVVDEASQIEIGDYVPIFNAFVSTIRKVCFIGDDKQLPPHGQEDIADLQSIFELGNLRQLALFLDTQYRMPPQIGNFISKAIYDDKLQSFSDHPIKDSTVACRFIDIVGGRERFHDESYMNELELKAVLRIARQLQTDGKSYRIITPYDAQRTVIENGLRQEDLSWEDKCFNVDSFQGNEDDYIVISLVRSQTLGFLKNLRRTNVMLTRCKRGMFICSSRAFLEGPGSKSLVGKMLKHVGEKGWLELVELETGNY